MSKNDSKSLFSIFAPKIIDFQFSYVIFFFDFVSFFQMKNLANTTFMSEGKEQIIMNLSKKEKNLNRLKKKAKPNFLSLLKRMMSMKSRLMKLIG